MVAVPTVAISRRTRYSVSSLPLIDNMAAVSRIVERGRDNYKDNCNNPWKWEWLSRTVEYTENGKDYTEKVGDSIYWNVQDTVKPLFSDHTICHKILRKPVVVSSRK